ncbi:IclR family transcriptional regulator [Streptomyces sp. NPDC058045]|uniref:IclR family transcriptional regulator n=1 Tax=Streptomyces sp. NPDC058045 TaxID=3346311 RepID=UPI0036EAC598
MTESEGPGTGTRPRVQSAARAIGILLAVADTRQGLTTREISDELGIGRQTVYHLLHTLTETGILTRGTDGRIILGPAAGRVAGGFERQLSTSERVAPLVRQLARVTDETSYAAGWHHGEVTVFAVARGSKPVQAAETPLGFSGLAHARASGKLLLALMEPEERQRYLDSHPLEPVTPKTITTPSQLTAELDEVKAQGYAIDREEVAEGVCCVAAPLMAFTAPHALAVSVPADRFDSAFEDTLRLLRQTAEGH